MRRRSLLGGQREKLVTNLVDGFIHGWSFARKVNASYGGSIIEIRPTSGGGTYTDIGFTDNELDEASVLSVISSDSGSIGTVYDQVGGRNMGNGASTEQPLIAVSGTIVKVSGKPYAQFDGTNDYLKTPGKTGSDPSTPITDKDCTVFVVFESQSAVSIQGVFSEQDSVTSGNRNVIFSDRRTTLFRHSTYTPSAADNPISFASQQPATTKRCLILKKSGTTVEGYDESGLVGSITSADTFSVDTVLEIGRQLAGGIYFGGKIAELLINNTALSTTDRNIVLDNIKEFYSIT